MATIIYYKDGTKNVVNDADVSYWQGKGWATSAPGAAPAPVSTVTTPKPVTSSTPTPTAPVATSTPAAPVIQAPASTVSSDFSKYTGQKVANPAPDGYVPIADPSTLDARARADQQRQYDITSTSYDAGGVIKTVYYGKPIQYNQLIDANGNRKSVRLDDATGMAQAFAAGYTAEKSAGVPATNTTANVNNGTAVDASQNKLATLKKVNDNGTVSRVVVTSNSQEAQKYFANGYTLETADQAPDVSVTMTKGTSTVAAKTKEEAQSLMAQGYTPQVIAPNTPVTSRTDNGALVGVNDIGSANAAINAGQTKDFSLASSASGNEPTTRSGLDFSGLLGDTTGSGSTSSLEAALQKALDALPSAAPAAPKSLEQQYTDLKASSGTTDLESQLATLTKQEQDIQAATTARTNAEQAKPVDASLAAGRVSEVQRQDNEKLAEVQRQKEYVTNQLTFKYNTIDTMMKYSQLDYQNATQAYNDSYTRAIGAINLIKGFVTDAKTDAENAKDDARANLTVVYNAIQSGGASVDSLSPTEKLNIQKLELQAGFPVGFYNDLQSKNPKSSVIATKESQENGRQFETVLLMGEDGNITTKKIDVGEATKSTDGTLTPGQLIDIYKNFENPEQTIAYFQNLSQQNSGSNGNSGSSGGSVAFRTNNPGNIKFGSFAKSMGATDSGIKATDGGTFAQFTDYNSGRNAQISLLKAGSYANLTVDAAMKRWSNNGYGADIVSGKIDANAKMSSLSTDQLNVLQLAMQQREGYTPPSGNSSNGSIPTPIVKPTDGTTTEAEKKKADIASMWDQMMSVSGSDKHISEENWAAAKTEWKKSGYPAAEFDSIFSNFVNQQYSGSYQLE